MSNAAEKLEGLELPEGFEITREQLESLPEEELFELYTALADHQDALQSNKSAIYLHNAHEKQIIFHKALHRIRIFFGGNRSGKTTAGVNEILWLVTGDHPYRNFPSPIKVCIVVQDFTTHAKDIIEPKIKEWFPPDLIKHVDRNQNNVIVKYTLTNGSVIDVKSHDQDIKIFEGSDYDAVWFDEPPPRSIFTAMWRGLVDRRGIVIITGTPITEPWLFDLYQKAQSDNGAGMYFSLFADMEDNAVNIGQGDKEEGLVRIQEFLDAIDDPDEREARKTGHFLHMKGLIFKNWNRKYHLIDPFPWPNSWPIIFSLDPHSRKPWALAVLGLTPSGNRILLHSEYIGGEIGKVAEACVEARDLIELDAPGTPKVVACYIDNAANVESWMTKVKVLDELNKAIGPRLPRFQTAPKNVDEKITLMRTWLKLRKTNYGDRPTFMAFDNRENNPGAEKQSGFVYEVEHYRWDNRRGARRNELKDVPLKENDDILDAIMQLALVLGSQDKQHDPNHRREKHNYARRGRA